MALLSNLTATFAGKAAAGAAGVVLAGSGIAVAANTTSSDVDEAVDGVETEDELD
jgi:hypothetical protein